MLNQKQRKPAHQGANALSLYQSMRWQNAYRPLNVSLTLRTFSKGNLMSLTNSMVLSQAIEICCHSKNIPSEQRLLTVLIRIHRGRAEFLLYCSEQKHIRGLCLPRLSEKYQNNEFSVRSRSEPTKPQISADYIIPCQRFRQKQLSNTIPLLIRVYSM